jgi:hypothetical protein
MRWLGKLSRMQDQNYCRKLILHKPEITRCGERPAIRWLDSVEDDISTMGVRNWRPNSQNRDKWRAIVKEVKVRHGL